MSMLSIPSAFVINPVLTFISRHYYGWYLNGVGWFIFGKTILLIFSVSALLALMLTGGYFFNLQQAQLVNLYFYLPLLIIVGTISTYSAELLNLIGKSRTFILLNGLDMWGKITFIATSILFLPSVATTVLSAITIWGGVFSLLCIYLIRTYTNNVQVDEAEQPPLIQTFDIRGVFRFAWPLAVATSFYWCQTDGYRFVLAYVTEVKLVGKFVAGFTMGGALMSALDIIFHQLYLPKYYKEISIETIEHHTAAWDKYAYTLVLVFIPFGLYISCATPFLARWLLGSDYWDVGFYASIGALSQLFRIFSGALSNGIIIGRQTGALVLPNLVGAAIALAGTLLLTPKLSFMGAGFSLMISHFFVSIGLFFKLSHKLPIQLPFRAMLRALKYVIPICLVLLSLKQFEFQVVPVLNLLTLLGTGSCLLYTQWVLSRDLWFAGR